MILPMIANVKHHISKIEKEHHLGQRVHKDFVEAAYQSLFLKLKVKAQYGRPLKQTPYMTYSEKEH